MNTDLIKFPQKSLVISASLLFSKQGMCTSMETSYKALINKALRL